MNENKGNGARLTEIQKDLKEIKGLLQKGEKSSKSQFFFSTGITAMIASLAILPFNIWGSVAAFVSGYVIMILSPRFKKS